MNRRGFLCSILAAGAAPAVITSGVLMPVRALWVPPRGFETLRRGGGAKHDAILDLMEKRIANVKKDIADQLPGELLGVDIKVFSGMNSWVVSSV